MVRCLIIDDEELARKHLARLLKAHVDVEIAGYAANGLEGLAAISEFEPDLVFLDVEMPGLGAFDMLAQLRHPPLIVFATAFDKYAISAFDANAIDYLLKPIQPDRLAQAVQKIRASAGKPRVEYESALRQAMATIHDGPPAKLAARRGRRIVLLSPGEVLYIVVEDEIVFLHTKEERFASDRTISELAGILIGAGFFQVNRSTIVNLDHARELLPWSSGTWKVKLSNQIELDVSRDRARALRSKIG